MGALRRKLRTLLEERFPGCAVELESANANRIGGSIVWPGFDGMAQIDRQNLLWSALREGLSEEDSRVLTLIITLSPAEVAAMAEC
jgi:acid stress-induced BolA-like protein IbaG/YrbA